MMLLMWGIVALAGFLGSQYLTSAAWRDGLWIGLLVVGNTVSGILGRRLGDHVRTQSGVRVAVLSLAVLAYAAIGLWIAQPLTWQQTTVLGTLAVLLL